MSRESRISRIIKSSKKMTQARSSRSVITSEESCLSFCVRFREASASALVSRVAETLPEFPRPMFKALGQ